MGQISNNADLKDEQDYLNSPIGRAVPRHNSLDDHLQRLGKEQAERNAVTNVVNAVNVPASDPVNSPSHYTRGGIETIDFIEAKRLNYNTGNAVKYISRAGKKSVGLHATAQDLEKAVWYLQREIQNLKKA